jgi:hypothetical protein
MQEPTVIGKLKMRSLPALSADMPMWDLLHLFKIGRAHMAVLCEASEGAGSRGHVLCSYAQVQYSVQSMNMQ